MLGREKSKECPSCALEVSGEETICPYCGYEFPPEQKSIAVMAWIFLILILLWLLTRFF